MDEKLKALEKKCNEIKKQIEETDKRIAALENLSKCKICKKVNILHNCNICSQKICEFCSFTKETKSWTDDFVILYRCLDCDDNC